MNTWYYDGIMPEYMVGNHEQLSGAGTTPKEMRAVQFKIWSELSKIFLVVAGCIYITTAMYPERRISDETNQSRYLVDQKQDKPGNRKDWMGTSKIG